MFSKVIVGIEGRQGGRDAITLATRLPSPVAAITKPVWEVTPQLGLASHRSSCCCLDRRREEGQEGC